MNAEELEKLHSLKKKGIITEEEFNSQKNSLLNKKKESTFLLLALLLGEWGIHNFYVGQTIRVIIKPLLVVLSFVFSVLAPFLCIGMWIWVIVEMCITKKTASGVSLIPASRAFKITMCCCIFVPVIGLLLIGGISGFTIGGDRYQANEALDTAAKYAVVVYAGYQTATAMGSTYTVPALGETGLTKNGKNTTSSGALVCQSAAAILKTNECVGTKLTHVFQNG